MRWICAAAAGSPPHSATVRRNSRTDSADCSTNTARAAPRDSASRPSAPLPANRSRQCAPAICGASQLNTVSRTRSGVGRMSPSGKRQVRPRQLPPMIRSRRALLPRATRGAGARPSGLPEAATCNARLIKACQARSSYNSGMLFRRDKKAREESGGFLQRLRNKLNRGSSWLTEGLATLFKGRSIDAEILEELESRLLTADVGVEATRYILDELRKRVARHELADVAALIAALRQSVTDILQPCAQPLVIDAAHRPFVILVVGVNGSGKTTTIGKLAQRLSTSGHSVMLAAGDTFRAAAIEQLQIWATRTGAAV